jgi:predicted nucleic acid-binding Zn ribbon protein
VDTTTFCPHCGAEVPDGAQFCPRCGKEVAVPVAPRPRALWWIIPVIVLVLGVVIFLLLTGAPYGRDEDKPVTPRASSSETETIREGDSATAATATLVEEPPPVATTTTAAAGPPPVIHEEVPPPVAVVPAPAREISADEAVNILRGFVTSRDYYRIGTACTSVRNAGYKNVGYTLEVHDTCNDRLLGLWRVDARTREIFRQREDGRYLHP